MTLEAMGAALKQERVAREAAQTRLQERVTACEAMGSSLQDKEEAISLLSHTLVGCDVVIEGLRDLAEGQGKQLEDERGRVEGKLLLVIHIPSLVLSFCG